MFKLNFKLKSFYLCFDTVISKKLLTCRTIFILQNKVLLKTKKKPKSQKDTNYY